MRENIVSEQEILERSSKILGVTINDIVYMLNKNSKALNMYRYMIMKRCYSLDEIVSKLLNNLILRDVDNVSRVSEKEIAFVKDVYNLTLTINPDICVSKREENIESMLTIGFAAENLVREYAKVLCITRLDALRIINANEISKRFIEGEKTIKSLNIRKALNFLIKNTILRDEDYNFEPISQIELYLLNKRYNLDIKKDKYYLHSRMNA